MELVGMLFITAIWLAIVIPIPCIPPSCGPPDAEPLSAFQVLIVYLQYTWPLFFIWIAVIAVWIRRGGIPKQDGTK